MSRPVIGVSAEYTEIEIHGGRWQAHVSMFSYCRAVEKAGGVPMILPVINDPEATGAMLDRLDGVVVSGGIDIDPSTYGAERHPETGETLVMRDEFEVHLVNGLVERDLPTLAICRGIQSLNVALGGTLIQHVDDQMIEEKWNDIAHTVRVEEGSKLADRIGAGVFEVNSLHHQVVGDLGDRAVAVAWNEEGHVEALEVDGAPHVLGIQWHPELLRHRPEHLALFEHLVGDAAECR